MKRPKAYIAVSDVVKHNTYTHHLFSLGFDVYSSMNNEEMPWDCVIIFVIDANLTEKQLEMAEANWINIFYHLI